MNAQKPKSKPTLKFPFLPCTSFLFFPSTPWSHVHTHTCTCMPVLTQVEVCLTSYIPISQIPEFFTVHTHNPCFELSGLRLTTHDNSLCLMPWASAPSLQHSAFLPENGQAEDYGTKNDILC